MRLGSLGKTEKKATRHYWVDQYLHKVLWHRSRNELALSSPAPPRLPAADCRLYRFPRPDPSDQSFEARRHDDRHGTSFLLHDKTQDRPAVEGIPREAGVPMSKIWIQCIFHHDQGGEARLHFSDLWYQEIFGKDYHNENSVKDPITG